MEEVQEFEEKGGRFKINGYFYNFRHKYKTGDKNYRCYKTLLKCPGSISISTKLHIIKNMEFSRYCYRSRTFKSFVASVICVPCLVLVTKVVKIPIYFEPSTFFFVYVHFFHYLVFMLSIGWFNL